MPNLLRSRRIVAVVIALASVAVLGAAGALVTSAKAAYTLTVIVGNGKGGIAAQAFMPADVVIAEGDSIKFLNPYEQIHTTTFLAGGPEQLFMIPDPANPSRIILNPATAFPTAATEFDGSAYANSGVMGQSPGQSKSWTLTFTEAGVYDFLCVIHPGMEGTVTVKNRPYGAVTTQAQADATAAQTLAAAVAAGEAAAAAAKPTTTKSSDGTTTWQVLMPTTAELKDGMKGTVDAMRFVPAKIKIGVGDTVSWVDPNIEPHTVTFTSGAAAPEFVLPEFGAAPGPPTLVPNVQVLFPQGGATYDGTGYRNSGFLGIGVEQHGGTTYSLKFTKAGVYAYICVIHADQGMSGVVEVGGVGVGAPTTGDGGLLAGNSAPPWQWLVLGTGVSLAALAIGAARVWASRRA